jgi:hypothetical protein
MQRNLELKAEVFGHEPTLASARVVELGRKRRVVRALRIALLLLGGALLSLPIPVWHLVGVPGFVIGAVVLGARRLRQTRLVESVSGPCPACHESVEYAVPDSVRFPEAFPCPVCREFVKLGES